MSKNITCVKLWEDWEDFCDVYSLQNKTKQAKQNEIHFDIMMDEGPRDIPYLGTWGYGIPSAQVPEFSHNLVLLSSSNLF